MPSRNQAMIRRGINRLNELIQREKDTYPVFAAVAGNVNEVAEATNTTWQEFQQAAISGDKEREERDTAVGKLETWISNWRPVVLVYVPGADRNIRTLPPTGATPDDVIRVAEDLRKFIESNDGAAAFREAALEDLGGGIEKVQSETDEATVALPRERAAREAHTTACIEANNVLVRLVQVVRNIFGSTSPQYRQFMQRASSDEESEIDSETMVGEE
jgi:hypothetical protein